MDAPYDNLGADTYLARAELLFDLDRFDEAREELGGALTADPAHVASLTLLAVLELQVDHHDEALTAASAALAAEPTHDAARLARGHALALLHRTEEALSVAEDIQSHHPESWWHNVHYALIVRESRNGQDALDAAWLSVKLAPDDARAHIALARVSMDLGLSDLAERALATAERLDPGASALLEGDLGPRLLRGSPTTPRRANPTEHDPTPAATPDRPDSALPAPVRNVMRIAGGIGVGIPLITGCISGGQGNAARIIAALGAVGGVFALVMVYQRLPANLREDLRVMIDTDRFLGLGVALAVCGPLLSGVYAATGMAWLLAVAIVCGFGSLAIATLHRRLSGNGFGQGVRARHA